MEGTEQTFSDVEPGQFVLSNSSEYVQLPAGEPMEFHISNVEVTKDAKYDDPTVMEDKLVIRYTLDSDVEGKGQVYTSWYRPSLNPKSKMFKMLVALYNGTVPSPLDVTDLKGRPLRATLTEGVEKNGKRRQYLEAYLKPATHQGRIEVPTADVVLTDIPDANVDIDDLFKD